MTACILAGMLPTSSYAYTNVTEQKNKLVEMKDDQNLNRTDPEEEFQKQPPSESKKMSPNEQLQRKEEESQNLEDLKQEDLYEEKKKGIQADKKLLEKADNWIEDFIIPEECEKQLAQAYTINVSGSSSYYYYDNAKEDYIYHVNMPYNPIQNKVTLNIRLNCATNGAIYLAKANIGEGEILDEKNGVETEYMNHSVSFDIYFEEGEDTINYAVYLEDKDSGKADILYFRFYKEKYVPIHIQCCLAH